MSATAEIATVEITGASKRYNKVDAVRDVGFTLNAGETIALVGHNGAGKTTLIKLMLGLIRPTTGQVRVLGEDPARGDFAVRQRLGYLPESVSFHLALTGRETLAFYARLKRVDLESTDTLFERVGLAREAANRPVRTYSKGMRQRLGLAQALLGEPRILLLDEPTSGLDPALRRSFYDLITDLRALGTTVLLSSHALTELEDRANRVIIINRGLKIADGTLDELRHIAQLPTQISVRLAEGIDAPDFINGSAWRRTNGGAWETNIGAADKIALLRDLTAEPSRLAALTVAEPTLDDLYAHFLSGQNKP
ncbi:ABC transporter ATP-binding protein [Tianweitania populi]|uniref:ABC transporter ATP-binding protein n=1 Tax=Tianweitania populi TaxID=1607949 RepID=A0A8J3DNP0_9HYPH|nr:ABC transporter ATP-binding protein [Tianweitania populi]GHD07597.1 ABC transporter ATP-binding protein [Tianweitania populi]